MRRRNLITGIVASAGMVILILDSRTALAGAQTGLELCIRTVIPSLFPFFLLSILLTGALSGTASPLLRPVEQLAGIPAGSGTILITGFLGGYPTGANCISAAYRSGGLSRDDAERMLSFCNNAGPAFLFGMVGPCFSSPATAFRLWMIHIVSAFLTSSFIPGQANSDHVPRYAAHISASGVMRAAISAMAVVCGWVILFRVVLAFLDRWLLWIFPTAVRVLVTGLLELSNGCCILPAIADAGTRFVVCSCLLACGGICVALQTASAAEGLSLKNYFSGKLIQTGFSLIISVSVVLRIWVPVIALLIFVTILQKTQKRSSNPTAFGV